MRTRTNTAFIIWSGLALVSLVPVSLLLRSSFPVFTAFWLAIPLVAVVRHRDARCVGFRVVPLRLILTTTALNLGLLLLLMAMIEPWAHVYDRLLTGIYSSSHPDITFAWLSRYPGVFGWAGPILFSGLVTLFAEEVFFRGWLLQAFLRTMRPQRAIALQAALFTLPQLLASLVFPFWQALLWVVLYSWLATGVIGGWAAWRTRSVWPSLISTTVCNLVLTALLV